MQVYYFTRTNRSEKVAKQLAAKKSVRAYKIDDGQSWKGVFGFLRAGMYASRQKTLPITHEPVVDDETVALVFPIWAGSFPPAVRSFVNKVGRERIICIPTSGSSLLKDREGFLKVLDVTGSDISAPTDI